MFTGIIKDIGEIISFDLQKRVLAIKSNFKNLILGESISCSGVCLTVSKFKEKIFYCNLSSETISKTNFKIKRVGDKLNLERSLKIGEDLSGHLVFGHIDGISLLKKIKNDKDSWVLNFSLSPNLLKFLTKKCSISIDGISLTVNKVYKNSFDVTIVPFTWQHTSLKYSEIGEQFNIEIDMLARYVFKALKK